MKLQFFVTKTRLIPQKWVLKRQMKRIPLWQISTLYMRSEKVTQISNKLRWFYIQLDDKYKVGLCISYRSNYFVPYLALKSGFGYVRYEYLRYVFTRLLKDWGYVLCAGILHIMH